MIKAIKAIEVKEAMEKANINWVEVRRCSICDCPVAYERKGEDLFFDGNCDCTSFWNPPQPRSYEEIAELINIQSNSEYKTELAHKFGFQLEAI